MLTFTDSGLDMCEAGNKAWSKGRLKKKVKMTIYQEFQKIVPQLAAQYTIPTISDIYFPPFFKGGQPKEFEFIALKLESGACGISFVLLADEELENYQAMARSSFLKADPVTLSGDFGSRDPVKNMLGLAALNAICQHVMKSSRYSLDFTSDSLGLLNIEKGQRVGMVGLFRPLIKRVESLGADLIIFEQKETLIHKYPQYNITLDPTLLKDCDSVLCTSTTVYNNTLDNVLTHCSPSALVSVIGPTAGYFPDPLFSRGVDVVGGTLIKDGQSFMQHLRDQTRWGDSTAKFCFKKSQYEGLPLSMFSPG
jgi:uncharacterized protein